LQRLWSRVHNLSYAFSDFEYGRRTAEIPDPSDLAFVNCFSDLVCKSDGEVYPQDGAPTATVGRAYTFTPSSQNDYQEEVTVTDRAGNFSTVPFTVLRDYDAPAATITVPARSGSPTIPVQGSGNGQDSGAATYDVQYRVDDGAWTAWLTAVLQTSYQYTANRPTSTTSGCGQPIT
jgi:hypothetical protein